MADGADATTISTRAEKIRITHKRKTKIKAETNPKIRRGRNRRKIKTKTKTRLKKKTVITVRTVKTASKAVSPKRKNSKASHVPTHALV
jgi:hypothetical protein